MGGLSRVARICVSATIPPRCVNVHTGHVVRRFPRVPTRRVCVNTGGSGVRISVLFSSKLRGVVGSDTACPVLVHEP